MDHDEDEFGFDDDGLDDLPAHALQQLEFTAIRATQAHADATPAPAESDYGDDDDDDEVVDLREEDAVPQASTWVDASNGAPRQHNRHHLNHSYARDNGSQNDAMDLDEPPQRSQADAQQLLLRVKKVGKPMGSSA